MGAPRQVRLILLALLYVAVLGIQITFPATHPLVINTGGSAALWLMLGGCVGMFLAYRALIRALRRKAGHDTPAPAKKTGTFSDTELNRYARHILSLIHISEPTRPY